MHEEETMHEDSSEQRGDAPQHTFGGRALDRYVYEFETVEGGEGGEAIGGLEGSEVGAGAQIPLEPQTAEAEPGGEPGAEEEFAAEPLSAEELQQMIREGSGEAFREMLAQADHEEAQRRAAAEASVQPELPEWDPFNPQVVQQHIMAGLAPVFQQIEQMMQPALDAGSQFTHTQGETQARELLTAHQAEIGDFDQDRAIRDAAFMLRDAEQSGRQVDPEQVLRDAAASVHAYEEQIEQRGIEKFKKQAAALGGAPAEHGSGAAGDTAALPRGKDAYRAQLDRSLANRGLRPGVGAGTG